MYKLLTLFFCLVLTTRSSAQNELWAMSPSSGQYGSGTIFKTDGNCNGPVVVHDFFKVLQQNSHFTNLIQVPSGKMYGLSKSGGSGNRGVLFDFDPITNTTSLLALFTGTANGASPFGSLVLGSDGMLYGLTSAGGTNNLGTLFQYNISTNTLTKKIDFTGATNGSIPKGSLLMANDGNLYGLTTSGGTSNNGTFFKFNISTQTYSKIIDLSSVTTGAGPEGSLIQSNDGNLYGITRLGGTNNAGTVFKYEISTNTFTKLQDLTASTTGSWPSGSILEASDNLMYFLNSAGGSNSDGTLTQYNKSTNVLTKKIDFNAPVNGAKPTGNLIEATDGNLYGLTSGGSSNNGTLFKYNKTTNISTKLVSYTATVNGSKPYGSLLQASNGLLYGFTHEGGISTLGTLFSYNIVSNSLQTLITNDLCPNGSIPRTSLYKANDGNLYGVAEQGGNYNYGVIFKINPSNNSYTKLFDFDTNDGIAPNAELIQATDNKLYGVTLAGGTNNAGTLYSFDITTNLFTKLHDFINATGEYPNSRVLQASDGNLYGLTQLGGTNNAGVIYKYNLSTNTYTKLYETNSPYFTGQPHSSFIEASDGNLYTTIANGGPSGAGTIIRLNPITNSLTVAYTFTAGINGNYPEGDLVEAPDGFLYGTAYGGGATNRGVIYKFNKTTNAYTKLYQFAGGTDGNGPRGNLLLASNGNLYGFTSVGGVFSLGIAFQYNPITNVYTKKLDLNSSFATSIYYNNFIEITNIATSNNAIIKEYNSFKLFPNPSVDELQVELNNEELVNSSLVIYDITGSQVLVTKLTNKTNRIDIHSLQKGIYFVKINSETVKLIKID